MLSRNKGSLQGLGPRTDQNFQLSVTPICIRARLDFVRFLLPAFGTAYYFVALSGVKAVPVCPGRRVERCFRFSRL